GSAPGHCAVTSRRRRSPPSRSRSRPDPRTSRAPPVPNFLPLNGGPLTVETLYHSGRILTMIEQDDSPEAVLVRDGTIAAVGAAGAVRAQASADPTEVDLAGRTLMPSFIDSHGHILQHGVLASLVDLEHARSIGEIVTAFRERLAQRDPGDRAPLIGAK